MEGATYFIEVYTLSTNKTYFGGLCCITALDEVIKNTKENGFKTIAVWKIKPKTKNYNMKYFLDQEFHERMFKPLLGKAHHIIELISIGIVAEDGRKYYAISKDFDIKAAWNDKWLKQNVLLPILYDLFAIGGIAGDQRNHWVFSLRDFSRLIKMFGKSNKQIAEEVEWFIRRDNHVNCNTGQLVDDKTHNPVEIYGYYADYDWVLFCSLFGKMIDLPKGFPMYCIDLKQMLDEAATKLNWMYGRDIWANANRSINTIGKGDCQEKDRPATVDEKLKVLKQLEEYPKQSNEHNALSDAEWNYSLFNFIQSI